MKYFKVHSFNGESIPIDEGDLERAIYAHMTGKVVVLKSGSISGKSISMISPDYHRAMGWNPGHKLGPDDWADISRHGVDDKHMALLASAKERVHFLAETGRPELIGSGGDIGLPERAPSARGGGMRKLGE